jgi:glycosyltransferase involved in cell wall biosynthesis
VFAQTYPNVEVIVVDDGSTNHLDKVIAQYGSVIKYIWQENGGAGNARNTGIKTASGDYIALLDHDDIWAPEKLEVQVEVASRHPESGIVACDGVKFSKNQIILSHMLSEDIITELKQSSNGDITKWNFHKRVLMRCPIWCPSLTLIPRPVFHRIGLFSERRNEPSDYEYYLRIAERYPFTFHSHSLVRYRYLASSRSGPDKFRFYVYGKLVMTVLKRYRHVCPPQYRSDVKEALFEHIRQAVIPTMRLARAGNPEYTCSCIIRVILLAIMNPVWTIYFLTIWVLRWLRKGFRAFLRRVAAFF